MPGPIIVGASTTAGAINSTTYVFKYRILSASTLADLGGLRGVVDEPVFTSSINQGPGTLTLTLDHYPSELTFGNLIRVDYPSGEVAGEWIYEGRSVKVDATNKYQVTLVPLVSELTRADFNANYSSDTTQPTAALGSTTFDVPVTAAIARTLHCTAGLGTVLSDGIQYSYAYNNASCADPLTQAVSFGGGGWWWGCTTMGVVSVRNTSPFKHIWNVGREVAKGEWTDDIHSLFNGQPVIGGQPANATTALTAFVTDTNPGNPYSIPNIGRRTAQPYNDSSLLDQASVNQMGATLLAYNERVTSRQKLHVVGYGPPTYRRPQPGDACELREPTDPGNPATNYSVSGPFLILDVKEYGATNVFDVTIASDMVVPIGLVMPDRNIETAIAKLLANPSRSALSPAGTVGTVAPGVISGQGGGATNNATPSTPVGIAVATGIDRIAQANNAYASVSWSSPNIADVVTMWTIRWRKSTDSDTTANYYSTTVQTYSGTKIPGLVPGISYVFQVQAFNDLGKGSGWGTGVSSTMPQDTNAPAVPTGFTAVRTPRGANVSWSGNGEADLQGYLLQVDIQGDGAGWRAVNAAPSLLTSAVYTAPKLDAQGGQVLQGTILRFRLAAVDWTGNQSAWTTVTANVNTDGVVFDDLQAGNIQATGTLQGGTIQTSASGARAVMDNSGLRLYDGTVTDHGGGPGVTANLKSTDGTAFFSGTVSASQIQGIAGGSGGTGARMWADFADNSPGVGPLIDINDGAVDRVQVGNLGALGNSPAQFGIRVNDASGTPIFDSLGLMQVMKSIATASNEPGGQTFTGPLSTPVLIANAATFTVSRTSNVFVMGTCLLETDNTSSTSHSGYLKVYSGVTELFSSGPSGAPPFDNVFHPFTAYVLCTALAAGTYTAQWIIDGVGSTSTQQASHVHVDVFLIGG